MKKIDDLGYELCKYQASLFEHSGSLSNCSSSYFYKQFMNSELAKRIDSNGFLFESLDIEAALDELKKEKDLTKGKTKVPLAIMSWIGYMLRYWAYTYEISSKRIFSNIKINELERLYEAYHSLDVEEAVKRISDSKGMKYAGIFEDELYLIRQILKKD
ncbi:MAG: antitoxin [Bacilli bacterium]|nr:antitoxin [Bacilli bacterium]